MAIQLQEYDYYCCCYYFIKLASHDVQDGSHLVINDQVVFLQGFVAYLKSVMMASNKKIFDVTQIDLDDFARLLYFSLC